MAYRPLADEIRPESLDDVVGQKHILGEGGLLRRIIETGEIKRLGSNQILKSDVRIIAATNRDLQQMVQEKTFREDLYYRLNVVPITSSRWCCPFCGS